MNCEFLSFYKNSNSWMYIIVSYHVIANFSFLKIYTFIFLEKGPFYREAEYW